MDVAWAYFFIVVVLVAVLAPVLALCVPASCHVRNRVSNRAVYGGDQPEAQRCSWTECERWQDMSEFQRRGFSADRRHYLNTFEVDWHGVWCSLKDKAGTDYIGGINITGDVAEVVYMGPKGSDASMSDQPTLFRFTAYLGNNVIDALPTKGELYKGAITRSLLSVKLSSFGAVTFWIADWAWRRADADSNPRLARHTRAFHIAMAHVATRSWGVWKHRDLEKVLEELGLRMVFYPFGPQMTHVRRRPVLLSSAMDTDFALIETMLDGIGTMLDDVATLQTADSVSKRTENLTAHKLGLSVRAAGAKRWDEYQTWNDIPKEALDVYLAEKAQALQSLELDWSGVREALASKLESRYEWGGIIRIADSKLVVTDLICGDEDCIRMAPLLKIPSMYLFHTHPRANNGSAMPSGLDMFHMVRDMGLNRRAGHLLITRHGVVLFRITTAVWDMFSSRNDHRHLLMNNLAFDTCVTAYGLKVRKQWSLGEHIQAYERLGIEVVFFPFTTKITKYLYMRNQHLVCTTMTPKEHKNLCVQLAAFKADEEQRARLNATADA